MGTYYLGQIILFGGQYEPENFKSCAGQLMPISGNEALYSLLGTAYGGDGHTTFALPDLRGRLPVGVGVGVSDPKTGGGPTLTKRTIADKFGLEIVALTAAEIPAHTHPLNTLNTPAQTNSPVGAMLANVPDGTVFYVKDTPGGATPQNVTLGLNTIQQTGASAPHANIMPTVGMHYIICTMGLYPDQQ